MTDAFKLAQTRWGPILALFLCGCTLALHVGKFPASLPLLVDEFNLSLSQSGNLVSVYALLISLGALALGVVVAQYGYVLFAITGVALCVVGSLAGLLVDSPTGLLMSRALEGFGWIFGAVSFPTLLNALCVDKDRSVVLGIWGAFMPVGGGSMMLITPGLQSIEGWRLVWVIATALTALGLITLVIVCRRNKDALGATPRQIGKVRFDDITKPESRAALIGFFTYSFLFVALTAFLPILLVDDSGMELSAAVYFSALVMMFNAIGNIGSGWVIRFGFSRSAIVKFALLAMGCLALLAFSVSDPVIRIAAALLFTATGGLIPGTLFSTAPLLGSGAAGICVIMGFMLTGTGLGMFSGPLVLTRIVEWSGHWYIGGVACLLIALAGIFFSRKLTAVDRDS